MSTQGSGNDPGGTPPGPEKDHDRTGLTIWQIVASTLAKISTSRIALRVTASTAAFSA